jgi:hypothetical protein
MASAYERKYLLSKDILSISCIPNFNFSYSSSVHSPPKLGVFLQVTYCDLGHDLLPMN